MVLDICNNSGSHSVSFQGSFLLFFYVAVSGHFFVGGEGGGVVGSCVGWGPKGVL